MLLVNIIIYYNNNRFEESTFFMDTLYIISSFISSKRITKYFNNFNNMYEFHKRHTSVTSFP